MTCDGIQLPSECMSIWGGKCDNIIETSEKVLTTQKFERMKKKQTTSTEKLNQMI
jgi:hypothetical protein